jgi:phosphatidylserine/phosphatidylglycerophosphate/cardiolipin synthase-like enzyme
MKGMAQAKLEFPGLYYTMIDEKRVDEVIHNRLHVKRIINNDGEHFCHSKVVMVDDKLMYIGSDNAYPSYNEEHGVWVGHEDTIKNWKRDYWDGLWDWCTEATD